MCSQESRRWRLGNRSWIAAINGIQTSPQRSAPSNLRLDRLLWPGVVNPYVCCGRAPSLWSFLKLANATDGKIAQFAEAWGPLGICVHGKTVTHAGECQLLRWEDCPWLSDEERSRCPDDAAPLEYWEPLAAWRFYARQFAAILVMASELNKGRVPRPEHVAAAFPGPRTYLGTQAVPSGAAFAPPSPQEVQSSPRTGCGMSLSRRAGISKRFAWTIGGPLS